MNAPIFHHDTFLLDDRVELREHLCSADFLPVKGASMRRSIRLLTLVGILCIPFPYLIFAQDNEAPQAAPTLRLSGKSIPNPNNPLSIAVLATNPTIAQELALKPEQSKALRQLMKDSDGTPSVVRYIYELGPGQKPLSGTEVDKIMKETREQRQKKYDEIMTPEQSQRLKQIAYQVEVYRVGLGNAITNGKLAEDVGISQNQKAALLEKAQRIEERTRNAIELVLQQAQEEMLKELSAQQRNRAVDLLGKPFYFRDDEYRLTDRSRFDE
ncbi:MAG: hypothetical protein U0892_11625 [Pirellulales bacterium]